MEKIICEIARESELWSFTRNGERGASYVTAEAAFEVVVARASIEMRSGNEIIIHVKAAPAK